MARVGVIKEAVRGNPDEWKICFQWCQYLYDEGGSEYGFRFIWRRPKSNHLQGARGQARIPSVKVIRDFIKQAEDEGWAENTDTDVKDW